MVICLERVADLHTTQLMLLPLTVSYFSKVQIGLTFLVPAHPGSPGKGSLNGCVCYGVVAPYTHMYRVAPDGCEHFVAMTALFLLLGWQKCCFPVSRINKMIMVEFL